MPNNTLQNVLGRRGYIHTITPEQKVYQGKNNPWANDVIERHAYLTYGLFRKITQEQIPKVMSAVFVDGKLASYAMCWQNSEWIDDHFVLRHHSNLGWSGVFTMPELQGRGLARIAVNNLLGHINKRLERNPTQKTPVLECEQRVYRLFNKFAGNVEMFPREQYPSEVVYHD